MSKMSAVDLVVRDLAAGADFSDGVPTEVITAIVDELRVEPHVAIEVAKMIVAGMTTQILENDAQSDYSDCA